MSNVKDAAEFYAWYADFYAKAYGWRPDRLIARWKRLSPILKEHGVKSVLDAACGVGRDSMELARHGFNILGVDMSEPMISVARDRAAAESLNVSFLVGDVSRLPDLVKDRAFDAVICLGNALLHTGDADEMSAWIRNMATVLRPAGLLFVQCQIIDNLDPGQSKPRLQLLRVLREEETTEVFLRRTCYRWHEGKIERSIIRLMLSSNGCDAEERVTHLQMVNRSQVQDILLKAGFSDLQVYADIAMSPFVAGKSDGVFVIARGC